MFRNTLIALLVLTICSSYAIASSFAITPEQLRDLRDQRALLGEKAKELDEIGKQIDAVRSEVGSALVSIKRQEAESNEARVKLEKMQGFDRENPGEISPGQLRASEERNQHAFSALKQAKEKRNNAEVKANGLNAEAEVQNANFLRLQKSFERDVDRVVDTQLQERIRILQVSKVVEVTEHVSCGEDSIPVCKERSKKAAELKATERGSVVFVDSLTEVKNFKLTKEEIRSEVRATLSDKIFSNQHMVGEAEYETTIKANVIPAISNSLREQMANSIRADVYTMVGSKISSSPLKKTEASIAESEEEEPAPIKLKRKKAVVTEVVEVPEENIAELVEDRRRISREPERTARASVAIPSF